jgi:hypothetical protein
VSVKVKFGGLLRRNWFFVVGVLAFIGLDFYLSSIGW